ncbi:hypothetical protein IFR05_004289 [Cadophora sp. M221]|nr:hypothetical protein IFR05_004289 [Cadophora sp. M221]
MKLKVAIHLALLGFKAQFVVAQVLSYGYNAGCGCTEIETTTVYVAGTCLPSQETSTALGTAVNPITSDTTIGFTSTEIIITVTSPFPTIATSSDATNTSIRLTSTVHSTITIEEPEDSSTEIPSASAESTPTSLPIETSTETQRSETVTPSGVLTVTLDESTSGTVGTATATTGFPILFSTSDSSISTSSEVESIPASSTFTYSAASELSTESTSGPEATPSSSELSTISISGIGATTSTAGGVVVTPTPTLSDFPTASSSSGTNSGEVTFSESSTETLANTSTSVFESAITTGESSAFMTASASSFSCTHHATLPLTTQTNDGEFTSTLSDAPIITYVSSTHNFTDTYTVPYPSNTSTSTNPLTTATDAGQFTTGSSLDLTTTSESSKFSPYSSGVTVLPTITNTFSEGPTFTVPSPTDGSSISAPSDTAVPPLSYPTYGHGTLAARHGDEGPTTLRKVRKILFHATHAE